MRKWLMFCLLMLGLAVLITDGRPAQATDNPTVPHNQRFQLQIPALNLDLRVVTARMGRTTWNFNNIIRTAGHLERMALPGTGGNVAIAAHSDLRLRKPGPFFTLSQLEAGAEIIVWYKGVKYRYSVTDKYEVEPSDLNPLRGTEQEVLTLLTCAGYNRDTDHYDKRLIVRAVRVE